MSDLIKEIIDTLREPMTEAERERLETLLGRQRKLERLSAELKRIGAEIVRLRQEGCEDPDLPPGKMH